MAVYQYTLFKYFKSPSTWIILILSMFIAGFLGGWLPFHVVAAHNKDSVKTYAMTVVGIVGAGASFLAIFISVFAGFKVASMYKDEVEQGTFLIMLSKPKTRGRIIFEKWLALQTTMLLYTVLTIISFMISIKVNDPGPSIVPAGSIISTLTSKLWTVSLTMWAVLLVIGFIFTSISLLLSTVVSAGATIGITIALGVVVPITSMVSTFTTNPTYPSLKSTKLIMSQSQLKNGINVLKQNIGEFTSILSSMPGTKQITDQQTDELINSLNTFATQDLYKKITKVTEGKNGLADLSFKTSNIDDFKKTHFFDLSYQIHSLGSIASDQVVPKGFAALTSDSKWGKITGIPMTTKVTDAHPFHAGHEYNEMMDAIMDNILPIISVAKEVQEMMGSSSIFYYEKEHPYNRPQIQQPYLDILKQKGLYDKVKGIIDLVHGMLVEPLTYVMDASTMKEVFNKEGYDFNILKNHNANAIITERTYDYFNRGTENYQTTIKGLPQPTFLFTATEAGLVNRLESIALYDDINHTSHFARVKKVPYANKYTILYIYLAIAILLTPLSFYVVRKQDFR